MKIIFSRKGFDSQYGRVPSPIFEDGSMVSLPIPSQQGRSLSSVSFRAKSLSQLVSDLTDQQVTGNRLVHLDPDLRAESVLRRNGWRPSFGQVGAAQTHLSKQGVGIGDVFLFFGWFRRVARVDGRWQFIRGAPDIHSLFGWLQVGQVLPVMAEMQGHLPAWLHDHPHVMFAGGMNGNNTLYLGAQSFLDQDREGAGVFKSWSPRLQLTAEGCRRSLWKLPSWMHPAVANRSLSYHSNADRWCLDGDVTYLQTVAKGQEFVMDVGDMPEARRWLHQLIC